MSTLLIQSGTLDDIADAIRAKTGSVASMTPLQMPTEIASIPSGGGTVEVVNKYINNNQSYTPANVNLLDITITDSGNLEIYISSAGINLASTESILQKNGTTISKTWERNTSGTATNIYYNFSVESGDNITFKKTSTINSGTQLAIIAILDKTS